MDSAFHAALSNRLTSEWATKMMGEKGCMYVKLSTVTCEQHRRSREFQVQDQFQKRYNPCSLWKTTNNLNSRHRGPQAYG